MIVSKYSFSEVLLTHVLNMNINLVLLTLRLINDILASVNETITTSFTTVVYLFNNGVQCFSNDYGEENK